MRRLMIFLAPLAVCLLVSAADPKNDKDRLQGRWVMVSLEIEGEKVTDSQAASGKLLVEGDHYTPMYEGKTYPETFAIDPSQSPKAIDFTYVDGPRKGETVKGIYKLEDDRYVMCRTLLHEDERPKGFASTPKSGLVLVVWKRDTGT